VKDIVPTLKPEFGIRTSLNRCFLSASSLFRNLKSRRSSATPATLNALRLEANKNQQFSFVLNPNSGLNNRRAYTLERKFFELS
jgi:hypothetical protein